MVGQVALLALLFLPALQQGGQTDPCVANPGGPKCIGRWMEPMELCGPSGPIGCNRFSAECMQPVCGDCTDPTSPLCLCKNGDEIAHAALIPSGPHAGQILMWTRCDNLTQNPAFKTYFWDPVSQQITGEAVFPAGAADSFCSGHTWVLDADGKAKLFTVGGSVHRPRLLVRRGDGLMEPWP